jgi:hypothetical protein
MWAMLGLLLMTAGCAAQSAGTSAGFEQGFYLEQHEKDYASAAQAYEQFAASTNPDEVLRREALRRATGCREEVLCQDMARLMPPDAIAYVELRRPGQFLVDLAEMVGLTEQPIHELLMARTPDPDWHMPFVIPDQMAVSPYLLSSLTRFGGAAVAVTAFDPEAGPDGVLVVNASEWDQLKGFMETAAQFAPPGEPIRDCPTLVFPEGVIAAMGERVLIVGRPAELVEQTVARLRGQGDTGLAGSEDFQAHTAEREHATLFAYVDAQQALKVARQTMPKDARRRLNAMRAILDLDHLRGGSLAVGRIDQALGFSMAVSLDAEHKNLIYNLIRTPPLTGKSFAAVPAGAAAVVAFGMNPTGTEEQVKAQAEARAMALRPITGMDIGREIFSNIEEVCVFVIPPTVCPDVPRPQRDMPIPDTALIVAAKDPERSQALWSEILSLVALASGEEPGTERFEKIGETLVQIHAVPEIGELYSAQLDGAFVLGTSMAAIQASVEAKTSNKNMASDPGLAQARSWITADSSIAVIAHGGRLAEMSKQFAPAPPEQVEMAARALRQTVFCLAVDEAQTRFGVRAGVMGLPQVNEILQMVRPMLQAEMEQEFAPVTAIPTPPEPPKPPKVPAAMTD